MSAESMVEKVARAICNRRMEKPAQGDAYDTTIAWAEVDELGDSKDVLESYRADARAAVEALMEPTPEMVAAGVEGYFNDTMGDQAVGPREATAVFTAMLRSSLKGEGE